MCIDDILERGLRATREGWDFEVMWDVALWGGRGGVKGRTFAEGHVGINGGTA
jgi:hypothetical protein